MNNKSLFYKLKEKGTFTEKDVAGLAWITHSLANDMIDYLKNNNVLDEVFAGVYKITEDEERLNLFFSNEISGKAEKKKEEKEKIGRLLPLQLVNAKGESISTEITKYDSPLEILKNAAYKIIEEDPEFFGFDIENVILDRVQLNKSTVCFCSEFRRTKKLRWDLPLYIQAEESYLKDMVSDRVFMKIFLDSEDTAGSDKRQDKTYIRRGDRILMGQYPQLLVDSESAVADVLERHSLPLPPGKDAESAGWKSYKYYSGEADRTTANERDFMWYRDEYFDGKMYRGVYFTLNRPYFTYFPAGETFSAQKENGYEAGKVYWFEYEPVEWTVLAEKDGEAILLSRRIIDAQPFKNEEPVMLTSSSDRSIYDANDWSSSDMRNFLNTDFFDTAFSESEKQSVIAKEVKGMREFTKNNVSLLSLDDVTDPSYRFKSSDVDTDRRRIRPVTDYAKCQGADGKCWALRSCEYGTSKEVLIVTDLGRVSSKEINASDTGVVPSVVIRL